ncbi:MAG: VWA domain-containing protein [Gemmatimonadota bacterium]|nr:MAG: VWA domain-containing protein [Gemmatimonadota bacterium]
MKSQVTMKMNAVLFSFLMVSLILVLTGTRVHANGPVLEVYKWADPIEIWHKDCELIPNQTTVTCSLIGGGDCEVVGLPVDVMLVLDRSGSMLGTPLDSAKIGANIFVDLLRAIDNAGLVSFGGKVKLNMSLAKMIPFGKTLLHGAIDGLYSGGSTPLGDAIDMANGNLAPASASGGKYQVLLTDGDPLTFSGTTDPIDAAVEAASLGITIFVIGLDLASNPIPPDQKVLLQNIAAITGGQYYDPSFPGALVSIFEDIAYQIICTVGKDIVVTETVQNYLNVLGACFDYSHFSKPPVSCTILGDGSVRMTWEIDKLEVGESWSVSFVVDSDIIGENLEIDVMASSKVNYVNYLGPAVAQIPQAYVTVKSCTPDLEATKTDNEIPYAEKYVDGNFSPGDTIKYDVVIYNDGYDATEVFYCDTVDVHTTLIADSIKAPGAPVTVTVAGDNSSFCVDIGVISEQGTVNISFLVEIEEPFPEGLDHVVNQGFVLSKELDDVPTDDPETTPPPPGEGDDPTITPVIAGAVVQATKSYQIIQGETTPGTVTPGGVIEYTVALQNIGTQSVSGLTYHDNMPNYTTYAGNLQNTCGGTVTEPAIGSTNPLVITNISLAPNGGCTIQFRVQVDPTLPAGVYEVCNQGIVYLPEGSIVTDDPDEPGLDDPTCTPVETEIFITAMKTDAVVGGGDLEPGGYVEYTVTLENIGNQTVTGLTFQDPTPSYATYADFLDQDCGTFGGITNPLTITNITLEPNIPCTITYRVQVDASVPFGVYQICNQGVVSNVPGQGDVLTDDPDTTPPDPGYGDDPTCTPLKTEVLIDVTKDDGLDYDTDYVIPGEIIEYEIRLRNTGNQEVTGLTYYDEIPLYTTFEGGLNNQCGGTLQAPIPSQGATDPIHITGITLAPNGICTITYQVRVNSSVPPGVDEIVNQGFVQNIPFPELPPGSEPSDDPETGTNNDPTRTPLRTGVDIWIIKTVSVVGGGQLFPGGQLRYTIRIGNNGPEDASDLTFQDAIPQYTQLSSAITQDCGVLQTSTPTINITNIDIDAGEECTIGFTVTLEGTIPDNVTEIVNGGEVCQIPGAECEDDTVRIRIQRPPQAWDPEVYKVATNLTNPGQPLDPGHVIEYVITIENPMDVGVEDHIFEDPIPEWTHTLILVNPAPGDPRNESTSDVVRITGIDIPAGGTFEIVFRVTLDVEVPTNVTQICNQGRIHDLPDENDEPSDDPSTRQINDPTCLEVAHEIEVWDPEIEAFMVALDVNGGGLVGGDIVEYTVTMTNLGPYDVFTLNFYCPLPDHTEHLTVTGIPFGTVDISLPDMVFITGMPLSVGQTIEIVFSAQVVSFPPEGVAEISCQGWVGNIPEMEDEYTDDPATPEEHDPTVLTLDSNGMKCDINDDGEVTITDLFMQLRHITYDVELTGDEFWAADFNGDETINIIDLMSCINVSVGNTPKRGEPGIEMSLADDIAVVHNVVSVPCQLRTTLPVAGAWFRLDYDPTRLTPGPAQLTEQSAHMALAQRDVGHSLWMLVYSMEGETIQAGNAPLVSVPFRKAQDLDGETVVRIDEAIAFLPLGEAIILESDSRVISLKSTLPEDFALEQNVPNPFNPETRIRYRLPHEAHVTLEVYNVLGQRVITLVDEEQTAGDRTVSWNGIDDSGIQVPSGVYFYTITMGEFLATKKMVLAK